MAAVAGRRYVADIIAGCYVAAYCGWLLARVPGTPSTLTIGEFAFYPLGLAVGWACWRNSRIPSLDRRTRLGWQLLALSSLALWLSGSVWTLYLRTIGEADVPPWVEWVELLQHGLALGAYLSFPNDAPPRSMRARYLLDLTLTVVAGFVLATFFLLLDAQRSPETEISSLTLAGALADWVLFVALAVGFARKSDATIRNVMGWLLASQLTYLLANYTYAELPIYLSGDGVDGLWFAAWVLRWTAARHAWHSYRGRIRRPKSDLAQSVAGYRSSVLSYLIVAAAFIMLFVQVIVGDREHLVITALAAGLMASILLVRQFAEIQENRRLFSEQLAQEARFRSLVQQSSDVVLVVDNDGMVQYVSPSATRVFGEPSPLVRGVLLRAVVPSSDGSVLDGMFERAPQPPSPLQSRIRSAAGDWRDVEIVWSDLRDDPAVCGIVLNCRDVTERNDLERRLQHAQKLDAVGHLAGGLAHDFNNVLTVIRGYTELLRSDLPEDSSAAIDLAHMEQAVDRASTVTRKLLAFSRRQSVLPLVLDLNAVLGDLQPIFRQLLTTGVAVTLDRQPDLWPIKADQGQIEQVIVNLATNARDAMPEGGTLLIATANRSIEGDPPGGVPAGDYVSLLVSDTGVGMDERTRERIFDPFFSTKPKDKGMGLGLAMVHGIVTGGGGYIDVRTAPGEGATFTILLPRTLDAAAPSASREAAPTAVGQAVTVLLVDDEPDVRTVARRFLEAHGYEVIEAADGYEATTLMSRAGVRIDVLLTDMIMPGMNGREVINCFRATRPHAPVVVMTGFAGESQQAVGSEDVAAVVTKPFSAAALLRAIAAAHGASGDR